MSLPNYDEEDEEEFELPDGYTEKCLPCKFCNDICMYTEWIEKDWFGRGRVVRIGSICDESMDETEDCGMFWKDESRTEFGTVAEAVEQWNDMQGENDSKEDRVDQRNATIAAMAKVGKSSE